MARVSIGLPFLNSADTLVTAVRSVFSQTLKDWELILVDDGSSDESLKTVRQIKDDRVIVVSDGLNCGLASRLNQIASLSKCEYLARMDADDIMHPGRLERQVAYLDASPRVEVLGSAAYVMDEHGGVFGIRSESACLPNVGRVVARGLFIHPTVIGRTAWFQANAYDATYHRAEDHELWARTFWFSNFAVIEEPLLFYRDCAFATRKYTASCRTDRRILRKYGLPEFGVLGTTIAIGKSYAKSAVYRISAAVHLERLLLARRNRCLSNGERESAGSALEVVRKTRVPGLD
jgi:glycosyltransferase involved in cell wall biosynthesis